VKYRLEATRVPAETDAAMVITNLIDAGLVRVPLIEMLPLEDAARAHRMIETGHVRGKLVLKVAGEWKE
jgi:NADPH:quinone reductase-like Zn-dependent oxidoreductase